MYSIEIYRKICSAIFFHVPVIILFNSFLSNAQTHSGNGKNPNDSLLIKHILDKNPDKFKKVLSNQEKYKIQILYTRIDRDKNNKPSFTEYRYGVDPRKYFYAASLVKLPCAALALEKINELNISGLTKHSRMFTDSIASCEKKINRDSTSETGFPSVAHYIRRMLLVSDNFAYSRIYEFLGQQYINQKLAEKGFPDAFIIQRFDGGCNTIENTCTNPIDFFDDQGKLLYHQKEENCLLPLTHPLGEPKVGKAFIDAVGNKIDEPKDFSHSNYLSLADITHILRSIIFPDSINGKPRFRLSTDDRNFLLRHAGMLPRESNFPHYRQKEFPDNWKKYFIYGDSKKPIVRDTLRIFNIVGQSYGFMSDVAYICDYKNGVEFMLSAVIYTNEDEVLNDNKYEYTTVALPWFSELGKAVYRYDRHRKRNFKPDLSSCRFH